MAWAKELNIVVSNLNCASCAARAERALTTVKGVTAANVNYATGMATVATEAPATSDEIVAALSDAGYPAQTSSVEFDVENLSCASCVARVETAISGVGGVVNASVNLASEKASVTYVEGLVSPIALANAATQAGYPARLTDTAGPSLDDRKSEELRHLRHRLIMAAILGIPVFVLEMGGHMIPGLHHFIARTIGMDTSHLVQFVLTTLVLFGPGRQFYTLGIPALLRGAPDMNALVALGTGAAYGFSVVSYLMPQFLPAASANIYFEAATVIVVLILTGRFLEARAKGRTGDAIRRLVNLVPDTARIERDGNQVEVAVSAIVPGDIVHMRPGERVAVDGTVRDGTSHVDEAMITGEPLPVTKAPGNPVTGGTVNGAGAFSYQAQAVGENTVLARIIKMVEQAQATKLPIQGLVDRLTLWFVPAVLVAALLTVVGWLVFGPEPALSHALVAGVAVLIIACPCAMGLATPTSIVVGTGRAADMGVLFRKGEALQRLQDVRVVAFDKTGTLTMGKPEVTEVVTLSGQDADTVLAHAAAVEKFSEHPVAHAILREADRRGLAGLDATGFSTSTGSGAGAEVDGKVARVGSARMMTEAGVNIGKALERAEAFAATGASPVYVAIDGVAAAVLSVADTLRPESRATVEALRRVGLKVAMISGDNRRAAEAISQELGISQTVAEVLPDGKVAAVEALRQKFGPIAFVGDGINDAPALASADTGIAIGTGTDIAIEAADVVLSSGDPRGVANALAISRATMRNIRQNLFWAFAYNILLIPVAAGLLYPVTGQMLSPMLAAGAMALSSVFVLTNALRLRFVPLTSGTFRHRKKAQPDKAPAPQPAQ